MSPEYEIVHKGSVAFLACLFQKGPIAALPVVLLYCIVPPEKNWRNCIKSCTISRPNRWWTFKLCSRSQIYFFGTHLCDGIASLDITPLNFSISAVCSGLCEVLQQSQLQKFHFDFFRLCGLQFCECASFTAVRKFHRRVAHLSSLRACF